MDFSEAINDRHSVRAYIDKPIDGETVRLLNGYIEECNREGGLHIQPVLDEPQAFGGTMARYGKFSGVKNYLALVAPKTEDFDEKIGYFGEKIVLYAQTLGLNTCWVAATYKKVKSAYLVDEGEKLGVVIALGYGQTQGKPHKNKAVEKIADINGAPEWFSNGVRAAMLAPTALNQQKFKFTLCDGNRVKAEAGAGFYTKIDLGIAKCHFEIGAGKENFNWE